MPILKVMLVAILGLSIYAQEPTKTRVFIAASQSWEISGGLGANDGTGAGHIAGGARPQTAEIVKTFQDRCRDFTVTTNKERADYVLVVEHEGGKTLWLKDTKYVVYNKDGDSIESGSTRSIGSAVKDICAILKKAQGSRK